MKHTFTTEDLVRFLYREVSASEKIEIAEAIRHDWDLKEQFEELRSAFNQLPGVQFAPSGRSLEKILEYSAEAAVTTW